MWKDAAPFSIKTIRLAEGDLFVLTVGANGLAADWPNLYCVAHLRPTGIALSTMSAYMSAICQLHNWAEAAGIDLRGRVESLALFGRDEVAALRKELRVNLLTRGKKHARGGARQAKRAVVSSAQWRARCAAVRDYVAWHFENVMQRASPRDERLPEARERLSSFREWMVEGIRVRETAEREGMSAEAQVAFLQAIKPGDPTNPFESRHQYRNHALWLTYYDGGARRSEALGLKCVDLSLGGKTPSLKIHRRPDDPDDCRSRPPRTKTLPHPVHLTDRLAQALHTYMVDHRPKYPNAKRSPYVFLSQQGRPLSLNSVAYMYEQLRAKVPALPANFSTHLLRYTWNDRFGSAAEKSGWNQDEERQVRNLHQGWTPNSKQGERYQRRRTREKGQLISLKMQDDLDRKESSK